MQDDKTGTCVALDAEATIAWPACNASASTQLWRGAADSVAATPGPWSSSRLESAQHPGVCIELVDDHLQTSLCVPLKVRSYSTVYLN